MIESYTVSLVIPCHNEAEGLQHLLPNIPKNIDEVIIIDNNSTDDTTVIASTYKTKVVTESKAGYGYAYQAGFKAATCDIIVTMDGDGQYPLASIEPLIKRLLQEKNGFLSASRFPMPTGVMTLTRKFGNAVLTYATRILFNQHIKDTQSGMWVFWRKHLSLIKPNEGGMAFSEEIKIKAIRVGLVFLEEHITYLPRIGKSKLAPFKDGWRNLVYLARLRLSLVR